MFYNNLTINGTGSIYTNGYRIFVKGILDLSNAPIGAINFNGGNGGNASGSVAGTSTSGVPNGSIGGSLAGGAGTPSTATNYPNRTITTIPPITTISLNCS